MMVGTEANARHCQQGLNKAMITLDIVTSTPPAVGYSVGQVSVRWCQVEEVTARSISGPRNDAEGTCEHLRGELVAVCQKIRTAQCLLDEFLQQAPPEAI
eukprot:PhM_4_TR18715/c1_g2_i1/m.62356